MGLNIFLFTLTTFAAVYAIIFENKLKKDDKAKWKTTSFKSELKKITVAGKIIIGFIVLANILNCILSIRSINENNLRLLELGNKSDSIKLAIVDNAVYAMEEQQRIIDRERENIFIHFQWEVQENIEKLLLNFDKQRLLGFMNIDGFISTKLSSMYLSKYESITKQSYVIGYLMQTEEVINSINKYSDIILGLPGKSEAKKTCIRNLLQKVEEAKDFLYPIYNRIYILNSYKDYEKLVISDSIPPVDRGLLNQNIFRNLLLKPIYPDSVREESINKYIIIK